MVRPMIDPQYIMPMGSGKGATSGRHTLAEIERTIQDLRQKESALQGELEACTKKRSDLIAARLSAYRDLAEVRTRHAISDGVIDEADRLSHRVENLLLARQNSFDSLKQRLARADARHNELTRARETLADRIETLEARLDDLALQARDALAANPEYRRELGDLETAAATHAKAAEKAARAAEDRREKGRAYEADPLFMYLWQRNYSSREYKSTGLIRWLDGKVARLIGFHDARRNYTVLLEIPVRLSEHVTRLAAARDAAKAAVDARETSMIGEIANADMPAQLRAAREQQKQNQAAFEAVAGELSDVGSQLNIYVEGKDAAFKSAVDLSAEFLGRESAARLMQLSRETPGPSDDEIAASIARLDADIAKVSADIDSKTRELDKLFEKRDELVRIAADFRRANYDDSASVFRGNDIGRILLQELIRGAITGADYWARTRRRQSWRKRPGDSYRKSESFPPFDDLFGGKGGRDWDDMFDLDDLFDDWDDNFRSGGGF